MPINPTRLPEEQLREQFAPDGFVPMALSGHPLRSGSFFCKPLELKNRREAAPERLGRMARKFGLFTLILRSVPVGIRFARNGYVCRLFAALDRAALAHSGRDAQSGQQPSLDEKPHSSHNYQQQQIIHLHFLPAFRSFNECLCQSYPLSRACFGQLRPQACHGWRDR